jgi:hypothetical protein
VSGMLFRWQYSGKQASRGTPARVTNCHSASFESLVRQQRRAAPDTHRPWLSRHLAEIILFSDCGRSLQTTLLLRSL